MPLGSTITEAVRKGKQGGLLVKRKTFAAIAGAVGGDYLGNEIAK